MSRTRPTGEQIRFLSQYTGDHILDDYMEAAEKGGRTLPDMLADIFDASTGVFRGDIFQFRVSNGNLEVRVGDYPDAESGWASAGSVIGPQGDPGITVAPTPPVNPQLNQLWLQI
jgi:hypothetical protein